MIVLLKIRQIYLNRSKGEKSFNDTKAQGRREKYMERRIQIPGIF